MCVNQTELCKANKSESQIRLPIQVTEMRDTNRLPEAIFCSDLATVKCLGGHQLQDTSAKLTHLSQPCFHQKPGHRLPHYSEDEADIKMSPIRDDAITRMNCDICGKRHHRTWY